MKTLSTGNAMKNSTNDVVYVYKKNLGDSEELKYSLRTVFKNWEHRKVWIIGDCPDWINSERVNMIQVNRRYDDKYEDVNQKLLRICEEEAVSEDFWLFNDDFFVMKKINPEKYKVYSDGTLESKLLDISCRPSTDMKYYEAFEEVLKQYMDGFSYDTHSPMLLNKDKLKEVLLKYPKSPCRRSIYGNLYQVEKEVRPDCKVYKLMDKVNQKEPLLSTTDIAFYGNAGRMIKSIFKEKCIYEY